MKDDLYLTKLFFIAFCTGFASAVVFAFFNILSMVQVSLMFSSIMGVVAHFTSWFEYHRNKTFLQ